MSDVIEVVFYIHGVSNDLRGQSHQDQYQQLHDGVATRNHHFPTKFGGAEWGWNPNPDAGRSQELLTKAQRLLGSRVTPELERSRDFTLNPARAVIDRFRPIILYGFGDMFYYVSAQGKQAVRLHVARQLLTHMNRVRRRNNDARISLTLLGHSAGSIIAFDLLFYLFFKNPGNKHLFLDKDQIKIPAATARGIEELQNMAKTGQLRVRRLITFGSPITPLACRNDTVVEILANDGQLDPADHGLTANPNGFDPLVGPRWINFWDKDDPIGWPVEPLMKPDAGAVEDVQLDVTDLVSKAHDAYWQSKKVHTLIADRW